MKSTKLKHKYGICMKFGGYRTMVLSSGGAKPRLVACVFMILRATGSL